MFDTFLYFFAIVGVWLFCQLSYEMFRDPTGKWLNVQVWISMGTHTLFLFIGAIVTGYFYHFY